MTHLQFVPGQPLGPESTLVTEHFRRFLAGPHPCLREVHLDHSGDMTTLVPPGLHIDRLVRTSSRAALLASSPDATLSLSKQGAGFFATATAATDADVDTLIDAVAQRCTPPPDD